MATTLRKMLTARLLKLVPARARARLLLSKMDVAKAELEGLEVRVADTQALHFEAAQLNFEAYAQRSLVEARGVNVRVTPYLLLPTSLRLVALRGGEVVATISLVQDSGLGLPLEQTFPGVVEPLRKQGRHVAEISAFAVRKGERGRGVALLMYKAIWVAAKLLGVQDLVIGVHPDAEDVYRFSMLFERLTPEVKTYSGLVGDAAAVALRVDLDAFPSRSQAAFPALKPGVLNPHHFFVRQDFPQVKLPTTAAEVTALQRTHARSSMRLVSLRPDVVTDLTEPEFLRLRQALSRAA